MLRRHPKGEARYRQSDRYAAKRDRKHVECLASHPQPVGRPADGCRAKSEAGCGDDSEVVTAPLKACPLDRRASLSLSNFDHFARYRWLSSRSKTTLQPGLRLRRCLAMHTVMRGIFGISALQSRKASAMHICRASAPNAKLEVENANKEIAKAAIRPATRIVLLKSALMIGPPIKPPRRPVLMYRPCRNLPSLTMTNITSVKCS